MGISTYSNEKLISERENVTKELEMLERSLDCIPESSVLGYLSVTCGIAYRKKKLQMIKSEMAARSLVI